ncbi:hypothetical protein AVEN_4179-1 [Araneus ventricosus]|uniref:Uncharacterized protein n=1 Tax=Araneus ventricosus TaxID=182803 RepID=A0A4Y2FJE3_ARAVE|nr:hypothetical protein AVEN_4179-1 [Araneus ventricosus]
MYDPSSVMSPRGEFSTAIFRIFIRRNLIPIFIPPSPGGTNLYDKSESPSTAKASVKLNGSRCSSSTTEAGVLVDNTGLGLTPSEGGTYYHWREDSIPHYYTQDQEQEPSYLPCGFSYPNICGVACREFKILTWATLCTKVIQLFSALGLFYYTLLY